MTHDHRDLVRDMGIATTDPLVGAGLPLWLPAGATIRHELERYAREVAVAAGCRPVYSPVLAKRELFERSGHWAKFADDMFPPMPGTADHPRDELVLRPANCPHHAMIYAAEQHSYRDLPVRLNELAPMFRAERSGVLSGLSRVRQINLDDTHVFARPDQVRTEVAAALGQALDVLDTLGIDVSYLRLSRRDDGEGWLGAPEQWDHAEAEIAGAIADIDPGSRGLSWSDAAGEAAFYGPKVDIQALDAGGREETIATVQIDVNQPERFDLHYIADDGARRRVVMIHRGVVGSMERMIGLLLEVHDGRLPIWLAPVQVCLLPVGEEHQDAADAAAARLRADGVRVRVERDGSLGRRLRGARRRRDALLGVIGSAEADEATLAVHDPATDARRTIAVERLASLVTEAVTHRRPRISL